LTQNYADWQRTIADELSVSLLISWRDALDAQFLSAGLHLSFHATLVGGKTQRHEFARPESAAESPIGAKANTHGR
jgi:hypothetical protein